MESVVDLPSPQSQQEKRRFTESPNVVFHLGLIYHTNDVNWYFCPEPRYLVGTNIIITGTESHNPWDSQSYQIEI